MRRRMTGLVTTALLMAVVAAPAAAQARGYVGFGGGASIPLGNFKNAAKLGWIGQVVAGITGPKGVLGGRIDGTYSQHSIKVPGVAGHFNLIGANADLVITPGQRPAKVHPYILGGIGFYNFKQSGAGSGTTKFAFNGGAGLQIHTTNRMDVFTEARFISVTTSGSSTNFIPITIGLRWGGI